MKCVIQRLCSAGGLIWFLFIALFLSACTNNQDSISPGNLTSAKSGQLHLMITDDPLLLQNVSQVNVTINKIALMDTSGFNDPDEGENVNNSEMENSENDHNGNSGEMDDNSNNSDSGGSYVTVLSSPQQINLMDLRNGVTLDLGNTTIPEGTYYMIRLYISDASIVMNSGASFDLKIPGAAEFGLKIFVPAGITVTADNTTELLIDFNLNRSLVALGPRDNPTGFHLHPVIRAVDNTYCGKLEGRVTDTSKVAISGAYVWLMADTVVSSTTTQESGFYRMIGLPEGDYTLFAAKEGYDTAKIEDLHVWGRRESREDIELIPSKD